MDRDRKLEEAINNDGMISAGNAPKLGSEWNRAVKPLAETKADLYSAITKLDAVVNLLARSEVADHHKLEALAEIHTALQNGINFLEHVEQGLKAIENLGNRGLEVLSE